MKWDEVLGLAQRPGTVTLHRPGSDTRDLPCEGTGPNSKTSEACLLSSYLLTRESAWLDCVLFWPQLESARVALWCGSQYCQRTIWWNKVLKTFLHPLHGHISWLYRSLVRLWVSWVQEKDPLSLNHSSPVRTQCVVLAMCVTAYYQTNRDINLYFKLT